MRAMTRAWRQKHCRHAVTISTTSAGVARDVCESCGHVTVNAVADLDSEVDRASFARPAERNRHRRTST